MSDKTIHSHDAIIVGGGLTGLRAAVELVRAGADVALVSKVHPLRSHSVAAQGGINASLGNHPEGKNDSWELHAFDTVKGSDYLADQDAVEVMCRDARRAVIELEHMGTVFSRFPSGKIAQRPFGGAGFPRTCYAADRTGHNLLHTLYEQAVACGLVVYEEFFVTSLVTDNERCVGCTALDIATGFLYGFAAKATLLATGGYGRVYARSTNALINTGDGAALALRAGAELRDMEFVQFHPTTLYPTNILITEGARGEGGLLYNSEHRRFMQDYAAHAMELAPRDIVARAIQTEVEEGRALENEYVHLDLVHLGAERIKERLPGIRQIAIDFAGIDPCEKPIPVQPGQHYSMGGVAAGADGSTTLAGLYAAGECACVSVHGANRLGGNSLLETLVFGRLAGQGISDALPGIPEPARKAVNEALGQELDRINRLLSPRNTRPPSGDSYKQLKLQGNNTRNPRNPRNTRKSGQKLADIRDALRKTMYEHFGVFRDAQSMKEGLKKIELLEEKVKDIRIDSRHTVFNQALLYALELENMVGIAPTIALGALAREESRGAHYRRDFPERDDERFLRHSVTSLRNGKIELEYAPVRLGRFQVAERSY